MVDKREAQLQYELESDAAAQAKRLQELVQCSAAGDVELPRASALISRMFAGVKAEIEAVCAEQARGIGGKYRNWLRNVPSDVAALISLRECIKQCSSPATRVRVQDLTLGIGKLLELEVRIRQAETVNPMYMQRIHDQVKENCTTSTAHLRKLYNVAIDRVFKGTMELSLSTMDMVHLGKFGAEACFNVGLIEIVRGVDRNGSTVEYVLNPEIAEFLTGYTTNDVRDVVNKEETRMVCAPEPWSNLYDGGYLSTRRKANAPLMNIRTIRKNVRQGVVAAFTNESMPVVFEAGNYLQSVPYTVHPATRAAIWRIWESGGGSLGVPTTRGPQRPPNPLGPDWVKADATDSEMAVFTRWKKCVVGYYADLREWRGRVREVGGFIRTSANVGEPIWFPVFFDKRCRWYYRGVPNPQGSDLAKSVLHFHEKKPLGIRGLFWLKVSIANAYGFDKERFEDRARWTEQNWISIERALDAPEDHADVWGTDSPWCMFSAAWELREAYRSGHPESYCTGIPVHMDATCSGLQHFSALLRDPVGAQYVNLTDPLKCGPKQDIYARVAANALQAIQMDLEGTDQGVRDTAAWWLALGIPRALAKKPVMTYVYGATLKGTADDIEAMLEREILPDKGITWPEHIEVKTLCWYAARKLFQGIAAAVPAAAAAMQWLKSIAQGMPNGRRMQWTAPTGFLVQHDYQGFTDKRIEIRSCGVVKTTIREWNEETRAHSMQNAISPNFVHALDASHLTLVANEMHKADLRMVAIHDSFGTHPCDVDSMHSIIREQFVELYKSGNLLAQFLWDVGTTGEVPTIGNFDLDEVLDSEFFFC